MHCRVFCSVTGLCPVDSSSYTPALIVTTENVSRPLLKVTWGAKSLSLLPTETTATDSKNISLNLY